MENVISGMTAIPEPPEKVLMMYNAVVELINENRDINFLKVSDITNRAGIGKGTAYEYFSSKEEIISEAMLYECRNRIIKLVQGVSDKVHFDEKIRYILDWICDNRIYHITFVRIFQTTEGSINIHDAIRKKVPESKIKELRDCIKCQIRNLMNTGLEEHFFTETDEEKQELAFLTMILEYALVCNEIPNKGFFTMDKKEAGRFVYESMVKALQ